MPTSNPVLYVAALWFLLAQAAMAVQTRNVLVLYIEAVRSGAAAFLPKPFPGSALLAALSQVASTSRSKT
jgi:FixJ family two-component response regulator